MRITALIFGVLINEENAPSAEYVGIFLLFGEYV